MKAYSDRFTLACLKNSRRRSSGLPLLDIRAEMARLAIEDGIASYRQKAEEAETAIERIKAEVIEELRATRGPDFGYSAGGRWMWAYLVRQRVEAHLHALGYPPPCTTPIPYGSSRP